MMATRAGHAPEFSGQTLRQIVHVSAGGSRREFGFRIALEQNRSLLAPRMSLYERTTTQSTGTPITH